jgi:hypothetical protein
MDDSGLLIFTVGRMQKSSLRQLEPIAAGLVAAAEVAARTTRRKYREHRRMRRGSVMRPGPDTPLWNELAREVSAQFFRYGEKAKLARLLRITRQRLHLLLVAKNSCPDAERTLQLLAWLAARKRGADPA